MRINLTLTLLLLISAILPGFAQECLPGTTEFTSQSQIDSFPILYPECTRIVGKVIIMEAEDDSITDLSPFLQVTSIGERLEIIKNPKLESLHGLENLDTIDNDLFIAFNLKLTDLHGLNHLRGVGGNIGISFNNILSSLDGINQLNTIGKNLTLFSNKKLESLDALGSLHSIGQGLQIERCDNLIHLNGLEALKFLGSTLSISHNAKLTSPSGLDSLTGIPGPVSIVDNPALTSLTGMDQLDSIGSSLRIDRNSSLSDLSGLNNLKKIGTYLQIQNDSMLTSLNGLDNLTSIGGNLLIDFNPLLTDLSALSGLTTLNGNILDITENISLTTLWGLENIDPASISKLNLRSSENLSYCELPNICSYLDDPTNPAELFLNADNCTSRKKIEDACALVDVNVPDPGPDWTLFPNPVLDVLTVQTWRPVHLVLFNVMGQPVRSIPLEAGTNLVPMNEQPPGMYILHGNGVSHRLIIQ